MSADTTMTFATATSWRSRRGLSRRVVTRTSVDLDPVGCRTYHHIRPPLRRADDPHPPMPTGASRPVWTLGRRRGRRALVYRYVWRDDLSDTFDESVRV